ncbi:MAG: Ig-like domain-containing protein [Bacteroidales bacterium]|jgi:hypothetical protein|nr:Ig-like domain-containing protein [Bacteroidales bacterium]
MKKLLFLLSFIAAAYLADSQQLLHSNGKLNREKIKTENLNRNLKFQLLNQNDPDLKNDERIEQKENYRGVKSNLGTLLDESFENFLPDEWNLNPNVASYWFSSEYAWYYNLSEPYLPLELGANDDIYYAVFDATNATVGTTQSLITPLLYPIESECVLYFDVYQLQMYTNDWIEAGIELYVEVSTDWFSWSNSTNNVLTSIPNYNSETETGISYARLSIDLSSYVNQSVYVRFRAVSDWGAFWLVLDNVTGVYLSPDLSIGDISIELAKYTPLNHVKTIRPKIEIINEGYGGMPQTESLFITGLNYDFRLTIPEIANGGSEILTVPEEHAFTPAEIGSYSIYALAEILDAYMGYNSKYYFYNVTEDMFAEDNEIMQSQVGSIVTSRISYFGNIFELVEDDAIDRFSIGFNNVTTEENFTVSIFSVEDNTGNLLFTSDEFTRTASMSGNVTDFYIPLQQLPAGTYLFTVNQLQGENNYISIATDDELQSKFYTYSETNDLISPITGSGNLFVRVYISQILSHTPEADESDVELDAPVTVTFRENITGSLEGITISDEDNNILDNVSVNVVESTLEIEHDGFEYNKIYTVNLPASAIEQLNEDFSWSFKTKSQILSHTPESDEINVALDVLISATFMENISGDLENITIIDSEGDPVSNVSCSINDNILIIEHDDLDHETTYTVTIPSSAINELIHDYSWSFTTIENQSGIDPNMKNEISIYPNPSSGLINIEVPGNSFIRIMDISGRILYAESVNAGLRSDFNLPSGIYFINIEIDNDIFTRKVIISK